MGVQRFADCARIQARQTSVAAGFQMNCTMTFLCKLCIVSGVLPAVSHTRSTRVNGKPHTADDSHHTLLYMYRTGDGRAHEVTPPVSARKGLNCSPYRWDQDRSCETVGRGQTHFHAWLVTRADLSPYTMNQCQIVATVSDGVNYFRTRTKAVYGE
ncbi:hypothetical protein RRG08_063799 [Elysia crispata]|uniref:Uncharacterized protein n=1 Tax=Elysia crispata TaxID=231223 RepID=A0AAE1AKA4_9GAST|nr:hypothetical protein RRG08_063799 [Elysia crispata]